MRQHRGMTDLEAIADRSAELAPRGTQPASGAVLIHGACGAWQCYAFTKPPGPGITGCGPLRNARLAA
jgi:hypothetical protein